MISNDISRIAAIVEHLAEIVVIGGTDPSQLSSRLESLNEKLTEIAESPEAGGRLLTRKFERSTGNGESAQSMSAKARPRIFVSKFRK